MKIKLTLALAASLAAGLLPSAHADTVSLSLVTPTEAAAPGTSIVFSGTVTGASTNTGSVYLNNASIVLDNTAGITTDSDDLFFNFADPIAIGESLTNQLFTVTVPGSAAPGVYSGTYTLEGGPDFSTQNQLATVAFAVDVTAPTSVTPEPASCLLLATGLSGLAAALRRRHARHAA